MFNHPLFKKVRYHLGYNLKKYGVNLKHPLIDDQSIKFPIFVFDHKNPLAVIDPIIAKIFSLKNEDNITPLKQAIDSSLSQRQLMFHLDALANNKILIKDNLSQEKQYIASIKKP